MIARNASSVFELTRRVDDRQLYKACLTWRVINALGRFLIILRLGKENIPHKSLRIAIVKWEPRGLYLNHDAMSRKKDMVRMRQCELIEQRRIFRDRFRSIESFTITAAQDVRRHH